MLTNRIVKGLKALINTGQAIIDDPNYRGPLLRIRRVVPFKFKGYKFRQTLKNMRPGPRFAKVDRAHANGWLLSRATRNLLRKRKAAIRIAKLNRNNAVTA